MIYTAVPRQPGVYSAFPTFVEHKERLFVFYRQARADRAGPHGGGGVVRRLAVDKSRFVEAARDQISEPFHRIFQDEPVFAEGNEMDAIVSKLGPRAFSLATRSYDADGRMRAFISLAKEPEFHDRHEVRIPQLAWFAFYGKGFAFQDAYAFPAYGAARHDLPAKPLILLTDDGACWELFSAVDTRREGVILNESSIVRWRDRYWLFARRDTPPFGLWRAWSEDLAHWSEPEPLLEAAQAPMAIVRRDQPLVSFRHLLGDDRAAVSLIEPFGDCNPHAVETYAGSPYDGGYGDLADIDGKLTLFYYHGNRDGQPCIKVWTEWTN